MKRKSSKKRRQSRPKSKSVDITIKAKIMSDAPFEQHFILVDGKRIKNVKELVDSLGDMSEWMFNHHVNEFKNDFSNWINDVFKEEHLAEKLKQVDNKINSQLVILKHLVDKLTK